jgi:hypothetical protein
LHKAILFVAKFDLAMKCWLYLANLFVAMFVIATMHWWQYIFLFVAIEKYAATPHQMVS